MQSPTSIYKGEENERKRAKKELQKGETKVHNFVENHDDCLFYFDIADGYIDTGFGNVW